MTLKPFSTMVPTLAEHDHRARDGMDGEADRSKQDRGRMGGFIKTNDGMISESLRAVSSGFRLTMQQTAQT